MNEKSESKDQLIFKSDKLPAGFPVPEGMPDCKELVRDPESGAIFAFYLYPDGTPAVLLL